MDTVHITMLCRVEVVETNIDRKLFDRKLSNCIRKSSSADGEVLWYCGNGLCSVKCSGNGLCSVK